MGFLDALFGGNTSSGTQAAAGNASSTLWDAATAGNKALNQGAQGATNALNQGATNATNAIDSLYGGARADLTGYGGQAQAQLGAGRDAAVGTILGGNANYQPFLTSGTGANTMIGNALGLGGAAGHDAAEAAFRTSPGYAFQVDQGTDAAARKMAALGMAGSGNTLDAITRLSSNLADQEYQAWLTNLGNQANRGLTAASGISSNNQNAGAIQYNAGAKSADLSQGLGTALGTLGINQGNQIAGIQSNLGSALAGVAQNRGQGISANLMGAGQGDANLGMQAGQAEDSAANANASVLSSLFGGLGKIGAVAALNPSGLALKL